MFSGEHVVKCGSRALGEILARSGECRVHTTIFREYQIQNFVLGIQNHCLEAKNFSLKGNTCKLQHNTNIFQACVYFGSTLAMPLAN